jgi:hypothetical protein
MSKLSEQMRRAARAESRPVGFAPVATAPRPTLLVIAETAAAGVAKAAESADALLLPDDAGDDAIKAAAKNGMPVGVRLARGDRARVTALREAGADFVVLTEDAAASALMDEELSYILDVPGEPSDTDLRALDALSLEAILAPPVDAALTIKRSIGLRRFVAFARKPLMLPVDAAIDAADLEALRELNVLLLLTPAAGAAALREKVAALPPRRSRRGERAVGVSSLMLGGRTVEVEEEEEEDEDE